MDYREQIENFLTQLSHTKVFEVRSAHLKLMKQIVIHQNKDHFYQDLIRPYGNSDIVQDVAEILGFAPDKSDPEHEDIIQCFSEELSCQMLKFHYEMKICVEIVFHNLKIEVGTYTRDSILERDWKLQPKQVVKEPSSVAELVD